MWWRKKFLHIGDTMIRISVIKSAKVVRVSKEGPKIFIFEEGGQRHDLSFQSVEGFLHGVELIKKALR